MAGFLTTGVDKTQLLSEASEVFSEKTLTQSKYAPSFKAAFKDLTKIYKEQISSWWEIQSIENYLKNKIGPRGLRITLTPAARCRSASLISKWEDEATKSSLRFMHLLHKEEKANLVKLESNLKDQIEQTQKFGGEAEFASKELQLKNTIDKFPFHLKERKHRQFNRDLQDFRDNRVYFTLDRNNLQIKRPETDISSSDTEASENERETGQTYRGRGFCVLQQSSMIANNIHYNLSTVVDHGETILFQCNEGMVAENKLEAKCELGKINYPRCTAADICKTPEIQNGFLKIEQQASYNSGSYVEFECNEGYVIDVAMKVKCENGQWSKLPVCYSPCKISPEDLTKHNIQLLSSNDPKTIPAKNYKHGTEISVACKSGFRRPTFIDLVLECYDGKFRYPRCFSGRTCRIVQDDLDENNLELDEVHDNEVFYAEGEVIQYKCKNGFEYRGRPTGICSEQALSYPKCT
ncbi:coagulation factor XIII B chain-like, partial [Bufo gargarizans]|uniref:coagulation factor XIII B chain-like n=1 Tax=Bufo gargarizans TaxID=30331 RepID=UPI001CF306BB